MMIPRVIEKMVGYFGHDTKRINHALKVFVFTQIIISSESLDTGMQEIIAYTTNQDVITVDYRHAYALRSLSPIE